MSGNATSTKALTPEQRQELQVQEIGRLRALLREQRQAARDAARSEMRRRYRIAIACLTGAALLVGGLIGRFALKQPSTDGEADVASHVAAPDPARQDLTETSIMAPTPWPLRVYVTGAVVEAGVIELPAGSLAADALEAAGGPAAGADLAAVNLAAPVTDNEHLIIPYQDDHGIVTSERDVPANVSEPIDINRASSEELALLPYIGETKATAIVAYREEHGAFTDIEEIQEVPGIGPVIFEHIAALITVEP